MQFVMQHVDAPAAMAAVPTLGDLIGEHGAHLSRDGGAIIPTFRPGEFVGAMTRVRNRDGTPVDVTDVRQATWGELEGRRLAEEAAAFLRAHVPGFDDAFLDDTATALGVRETRRVVGDYVLTGDDVTRGASFGDAVARGAWPREYHVRGRTTEYEFLPAGTSYQVPYGSLRPRGVPNLLVAGRCLSARHDAPAPIRGMGPSPAAGQAAGTPPPLAPPHGVPLPQGGGDELPSSLSKQGAGP